MLPLTACVIVSVLTFDSRLANEKAFQDVGDKACSAERSSRSPEDGRVHWAWRESEAIEGLASFPQQHTEHGPYIPLASSCTDCFQAMGREMAANLISKTLAENQDPAVSFVIHDVMDQVCFGSIGDLPELPLTFG